MSENFVTTKARRPKNAWYMFCTKVGETFEISLGYKNSKGVSGPYSTSAQNVSVKTPYGPPTNCIYKSRIGGSGETVREFSFKNSKRISAGCNEVLFNNIENDVNPFSQRITALFVSNKKNLLANYFSATQCSKDFVHHDENYDSDGLFIGDAGVFDKSTVALEEILRNGGSLDGLREFIQLAKNHATFGCSSSDALSEVFKPGGKRNSAPVNTKPIKMSKKATMDANEMAELEDPKGLETKFKSLYVGVRWIPLDNISLSKELNITPNMFRVSKIVESIKVRYDPSQAVLVVAPIDEKGTKDSSLDIDNSASNWKFVVIQKIHTFTAFKELDKAGDLVNLYGHEGRKLLCYVVKTNSLPLMRYGNIRGNDISSKFSGRKTFPQDLLHVYETFTAKDNATNSLKVVERIAKLGRVGPNEGIALRKLCKWKIEAYSCLMEVIKAFEAYETLDVRANRQGANMSRGDKHTIINALFVNLGKVDENYFEGNYLKVINKEISLATLVDNYKKMKSVEKVYAVLSEISGYKSIDILKESHAGKFEVEVVSQYIGAEINGSQKNKKALHLEDYYNKVTSNACEDTTVEMIKIQSLDDMKVEAAISDSDALVLILKTPQSSICVKIIQNILLSSKSFHVGLLIFPNELLGFEVLSFLRGQNQTLLHNIKIIPLSFLQESSGTCNGVHENVKYGLLFGKFTIHCAHFKVFYNSIECLKEVIQSVVEPLTEVSVLAEPNLPLVEIHTEKLDKKIRYFGSNITIDKFNQTLEKDRCMFGEKTPKENKIPEYEKSSSSTQDTSAISDYGLDSKIDPLNNNPESSTSPFKTPQRSLVEPKFLQKQPKNLFPNVLDNLDKIAADIEKD